MTKYEFIKQFMKEHGCMHTYNLGSDEFKPQLLKFVKGSFQYNVIYNNSDDNLTMVKFRTKASRKKPFGNIPAASGQKNTFLLKVDLKHPDSIKRLEEFL